MSKVIYTICSYDDEHSDIVNGCINSSLVTIKRYADFHGADLKIIKDIPDEVTNLLNDISIVYNKKINHEYKVWNTKFFLIHEFYKSNYDKMIYIDCDHFIKNYNIDVFKYDECFNIKRKIQKPDKTVHDPIKLCKQFLDKDINMYFNASFFYLTKNYKYNLAEILNFNDIYNLWKLDIGFLREECSLAYLMHTHNIQKHIDFELADNLYIYSKNNKKNIGLYTGIPGRTGKMKYDFLKNVILSDHSFDYSLALQNWRDAQKK
jgi:hypothetical protein